MVDPSGYSINKSTISDNISMKKTWKIIKSNAGYILQTKSDSLLSLKKMQKLTIQLWIMLWQSLQIQTTLVMHKISNRFFFILQHHYLISNDLGNIKSTTILQLFWGLHLLLNILILMFICFYAENEYADISNKIRKWCINTYT